MNEDLKMANIVSVVKNGNITHAIKEWKKKSFYLIKELKERRSFEKPSVKKRTIKKAAIHKNGYRIQEED